MNWALRAETMGTVVDNDGINDEICHSRNAETDIDDMIRQQRKRTISMQKLPKTQLQV